MGYGFWWSPPEPPPNYVKLALDREVLCEAQAVTARASNTREDELFAKAFEALPPSEDELFAKARKPVANQNDSCNVGRLGNIDPFLQRLPLSAEAKEAAWTAFYRAGSPTELDAALAKLPLRTEDKEALGRSRWKLTTLREQERLAKKRSTDEIIEAAVASILRRREPMPPAEGWKGDSLLAHLGNPSHFRILLPDLSEIEDSELRLNLARYERDRARGIPPEAYRFSRMDVTAIALEIVALTALAGLLCVLSGRDALPRNTPKDTGASGDGDCT